MLSTWYDNLACVAAKRLRCSTLSDTPLPEKAEPAPETGRPAKGELLIDDETWEVLERLNNKMGKDDEGRGFKAEAAKNMQEAYDLLCAVLGTVSDAARIEFFARYARLEKSRDAATRFPSILRQKARTRYVHEAALLKAWTVAVCTPPTAAPAQPRPRPRCWLFVLPAEDTADAGARANRLNSAPQEHGLQPAGHGHVPRMRRVFALYQDGTQKTWTVTGPAAKQLVATLSSSGTPVIYATSATH